jgi:23S rRNA pseudouridine2605 synthase
MGRCQTRPSPMLAQGVGSVVRATSPTGARVSGRCGERGVREPMQVNPTVTKKKPRPSASDSSHEKTPASAERLQKVLAAAGLGSRRQCEELILAGRVEVDGEVADELGVKVDPLQQEIRVDGTKLPRPTRRYYLVNKPTGVVCTNRDPAGRMRLIDLIPTDERLFSVGRLDRSSEGLILVTNDGEFANRLAHPRYGVHKTYRVLVAGCPEPDQLQQLIRGVHMADGVARAVSVRVKKKHRDSTELEVVLNEGKNREIRRVLARIGHKVLRLKRIAIGSVKLGDLPAGDSRRLNQREVRDLLAETERPTGRRSPTADRAPSPPAAGKAKKTGSRSAGSRAPSVTPAPRTGSVLTFDTESETSAQAPTGRKKASRRPGGRPASRQPTGKAGAKKQGNKAGSRAAGEAGAHAGKRFKKRQPDKGGRQPKGKKPAGGQSGRQAGGRSARKGRG